MTASPLPAPPAVGELLSAVEATLAAPPGPLARTDLAGLLRAVIEEPTLTPRMRADPLFAAAWPQVEAWVEAVTARLRLDVGTAAAAVQEALRGTAPLMPMASSDQATRRVELEARLPDLGAVEGGFSRLVDAARSLSGTPEAAQALVRAVRERVVGDLRDEVSRLARRLEDAPGTVRRSQSWAIAARDTGKVQERLASLTELDADALAAEVEDSRRLLGAHGDALDLLEQEEHDRIRLEMRERERRLREDRTALVDARARLPRIHALMLSGLGLAVLTGSLAPGPLLVLTGVPVVFAMLDIRENLADLKARTWTIPRGDVDDFCSDLTIRFTLAVLMLVFLAIALLAIEAMEGMA